jgi:hypothetical protein
MPKAVVGERADHPAHFAITHRHKRAIALIGWSRATRICMSDFLVS